MEFSKEKTLITHSNTFARFLGYNVRVRCDQQIKPKEKFKTYSMNNKVELSISFKDKIEKFLNKWNYKAEIRQWEIRAYTPITFA